MLKRRAVLATLLNSATLLAVIVVPSNAQQPVTKLAFKAYLANKADSAAALFKIAVSQHPSDAGLRAWQAEAALRSSNPAEALQPADDALRLDPCNAQAHLVRASLFMPRWAPRGRADNDSTWAHLMDAVKCDSSDGNAWSYVWKYAIIRRDGASESRALRALVATRFLTPPQIAYAEWMLRSLPPRAVLLTGGDMDTYAPLAAQVAMGVRPDVSVLNVVMLNAQWYSQPMLARHQLRYDAKLAVDSTATDAQQIITWLRREAVTRALGRPVAFALTAPIDTTSRDSALQLAGPYWLVVRPGVAKTDSSRIVESLQNADAFDWRGPAVAPSDRSPFRRLYEPRPALNVTRVALLDNALTAPRDRKFIRNREQWISNFLRRAGIDWPTIDLTLQAFRSSTSG
jgi:hypothetical protein